MLTDEQLTERLRAALAQQTAHLDPPPDLLARVHAGLASTPPRRQRRPVLVLSGGVAVAAAIAIAALVLIGHRAHPPAITTLQTTVPGHTAGRAPSLTLVTGSVGRYCPGPADLLTACQSGSPQRLVQLAMIAPRAAGRGSWYAWTVTAPAACAQASAGGPTRRPIAAGTRLVFDAALPPSCRGTVKALVVYVTAASRSDSERFAPVGRASVTVP